VDNGISFGPIVYNYFVRNWTQLRVAALRRASIERLRGLARADLDFLRTVQQLAADASGVLRLVEPQAPFDAAGARRRDTTLQLGLTEGEIDAVWQRMRGVVAAVDEGRIPVF
jgi:hypothetical protein